MGQQDQAPSEDALEAVAFEAALERLEEVVDQLEGGDLELEAALQAFEQGVKLSAHCASRLDSAERRIELLMREGERWISRPFESDGDVEEPEED